MTLLLTIDPGQSGGLAWASPCGDVCCCSMPATPGDLASFLRNLREACGELSIVMEKTGTYRPGMSAPALCKFARHCGQLEGLCLALQIPVVQVAPAVWMKALGALPKEKAARKNAIKAQMQQRFPHLAVTLATADALGLLVWARERRAPAPLTTETQPAQPAPSGEAAKEGDET